MKITWMFILLWMVIESNAQTTQKISLPKGQKLEQHAKMDMTFTTDVIGQSVQNTVQSSSISTIEVADSSQKGYDLLNTLVRVVFKASTLGQEMAFDSDKKEDMEGQFGEAFKDRIGKPSRVSINHFGKIVSTDSVTKSGDGGLMGLMGVMGDGENVGESFAAVANLPRSGVKVGGQWVDSTLNENGKFKSTYTLTKISGDSGTVDINTNFSGSREMEQQGMTMMMTMAGTIQGSYVFDRKTGVIRSREATTKGTGNLEVMGQQMPAWSNNS